MLDVLDTASSIAVFAAVASTEMMHGLRRSHCTRFRLEGAFAFSEVGIPHNAQLLSSSGNCMTPIDALALCGLAGKAEGRYFL